GVDGRGPVPRDPRPPDVVRGDGRGRAEPAFPRHPSLSRPRSRWDDERRPQKEPEIAGERRPGGAARHPARDAAPAPRADAEPGTVACPAPGHAPLSAVEPGAGG